MPSILNDTPVLKEALETSNSIKEALTKLGLRAAGGNYKALIVAATKAGLTIKRGVGSTIKANIATRRPLEDILVENSKYARHALKKRLIKERLIPYICALCGCLPCWNDKPLSLQLEHINGVYNDNRIENLCFLCPNCHSQTSTYAGRNSRIAVEARLKPKTSYIQSRQVYTKTKWPPIKELLAEIKLTSKSEVARKLNVSEAAVRKRIKTHAPK